jgi:hypothetical protein
VLATRYCPDWQDSDQILLDWEWNLLKDLEADPARNSHNNSDHHCYRPNHLNREYGGYSFIRYQHNSNYHNDNGGTDRYIHSVLDNTNYRLCFLDRGNSGQYNRLNSGTADNDYRVSYITLPLGIHVLFLFKETDLPFFSFSTVTTATPVVVKRATPAKIGDVVPDSPKELFNVALDLAFQACSCFLPPKPAITSTVDVTSTILTTVDGIVTDTVTVPQTTVTSTATVTNTNTVTQTESQIVTVPVTTTVPATLSTITTTTTTRMPVSTVVVPVLKTYTKIESGSGCTYNRYYDFPSVSNSPGPNGNYAPGVTQCEALCTANANCKMFFYIRFDPALARGFDGGACVLDSLPYDPSLKQCQYPTQFYAVYNKNPWAILDSVCGRGAGLFVEFAIFEPLAAARIIVFCSLVG